jgi:hypothetical protein
MATTTPNFGWPVPTSTDLVKNGATAIEGLGDAIDASLLDLKGGTTGQVLAKASNTNMDFSWVAQDDSNAIQNAIVDAKGDLIAATANDTPARLAVGTNDLILTAASGEATGLKWSGAWSSYTPTFTNLTVGNGVLTARYCQLGKIVMGYISFVMGSTSSMGSAPYFTLPVTAFSSTANVPLGNFYAEDVGIAGYNGAFYSRTATTASPVAIFATQTYLGGSASITSTVPLTWGTNDFFNGYFTYEAA